MDLVDRLIAESDIEKASCDPPQNTRARLRGMIVQQACRHRVDVQVENWENIRLRARNNLPGARHCFHRLRGEVNSLGICLADPFQAQDPLTMAALRTFMERWGGHNDG